MDPHAYLLSIGSQDAAQLDLGRAAVALSALQRPDINTEKYLRFFDRLYESIAPYAEVSDAQERVAVLRDVVFGTFQFASDTQTPRSIENGLMASVVERRRGGAVALSVLCMAAAQSVGWDVYGLPFPVQFLMRVDGDGARLVVDPLQSLATLQAHDLRTMLKDKGHRSLELRADYFNPVDNRATLLRLHNFVKARQIEVEDYIAAIQTITQMRLFAPDEPRLWFDEGVMLSRLERPQESIAALSRYLDMAPNAFDRDEVEQMIAVLGSWLR